MHNVAASVMDTLSGIRSVSSIPSGSRLESYSNHSLSMLGSINLAAHFATASVSDGLSMAHLPSKTSTQLPQRHEDYISRYDYIYSE